VDLFSEKGGRPTSQKVDVTKNGFFTFGTCYPLLGPILDIFIEKKNKKWSFSIFDWGGGVQLHSHLWSHVNTYQYVICHISLQM